MTVFLYYLIGINILTLFLFAHDKHRARSHSQRISEKTLLWSALLGGSPASLYAMQRFRHKTKKIAFQLILYCIILIQVLAIATYTAQKYSKDINPLSLDTVALLQHVL